MSESLDQLKINRSDAPHRKRRWHKPFLLATLAVAVIGIVAIAARGKAVEVETVRVTQAWPAQAITQLNATGYVTADRKASVASKGTGRLEWLGVREGSAVKEGEIIARLENTDMQAQLAQAHANVEVARAQQQKLEADRLDARLNLKRQKELATQKFVSPSAVDTAESRYQQAVSAVAAQAATVRMMQAAERNAQAALDNTIIRAPFAGVVLTKQANVGDVVAPFSTSADSKGAVVSMADLSTLEVEADVSETSLAKARVGQPCEIQLDALPDKRLLGSVARIVPTVDRSKATVKFKIKFEETDARVLPDMSAKVAFLSRPLKDDERQPRLAVAPEAVKDGIAFVVGKDNTVSARKVTLGDKLGDLVEVKEGLQNGETVVLAPSPRLKDGARIAEKKK
ncbi:RND family efflux transporter, MFP subunit [Formivibrio citricus]|uniref:RND family efflux transporter, MFP subunit n=1 Tax=Formivibrio citricus TaxID=83765 RepID=A0A1I5BKT9_9NEIS|nr:efflux RND transporter periplasmic adaptor subunit [Formivibrio citricus]SFN75209.1 RND family efflux transporter, MFP subunit [Formivibrio citricus]